MINLHGSLWRLWEMVCYVCVCSCVYSPSSCLEKGSERNVAADRTGFMHPKRRTTSNNLSFSINSLLSVATWVIFTGSRWRLASQFLATCRQPNTDGLNGIHQLTDLSRLINSLSLLELSIRLSFSQTMQRRRCTNVSAHNGMVMPGHACGTVCQIIIHFTASFSFLGSFPAI